MPLDRSSDSRLSLRDKDRRLARRGCFPRSILSFQERGQVSSLSIMVMILHGECATDFVVTVNTLVFGNLTTDHFTVENVRKMFFGACD